MASEWIEKETWFANYKAQFGLASDFYREKKLTLPALLALLKSDWQGAEIFRLQMEFDPVEFLKRAAEGNNTLMVASSGGVGEYWTEEMQAAFESATGSQIDLRAIGKAAYACVSDRGELVAEETDGGKTVRVKAPIEEIPVFERMA